MGLACATAAAWRAIRPRRPRCWPGLRRRIDDRLLPPRPRPRDRSGRAARSGQGGRALHPRLRSASARRLPQPRPHHQDGGGMARRPRARGRALQGILRRPFRQRLLRAGHRLLRRARGGAATIRRRACSIARPATTATSAAARASGRCIPRGRRWRTGPRARAQALPGGLRRRRRGRLRAPGARSTRRRSGRRARHDQGHGRLQEGLRRRPPAELLPLRPPPAPWASSCPRTWPRDCQRMQTACDASVGDACFEIGVLYENAEGVPRDRQRALALLQAGLHGGARSRPAQARYEVALSAHAQRWRRRAFDLHRPARLRMSEKEPWACSRTPRPRAGPGRPRPPPATYRGSPTRGWPGRGQVDPDRCGRPVGIVASTSACPSLAARTRTWVRAGLPGGRRVHAAEARMGDEADRRVHRERGFGGHAADERAIALDHRSRAPGGGVSGAPCRCARTARGRSAAAQAMHAVASGNRAPHEVEQGVGQEPARGHGGQAARLGHGQEVRVAEEDRERERHRGLLPRRPPPDQRLPRRAAAPAAAVCSVDLDLAGGEAPRPASAVECG